MFSKRVVWLSLNPSSRFRFCSNQKKPDWIPFSKARHGDFIQEKPQLKNPFQNDAFLRRLMRVYFPETVLASIQSDLNKFGDRIVNEIEELGEICERETPKLVPADAWGAPGDALWTSSAWKKQKDICAEEGIVAIPYEKKFNEWSRLYQLVKLFMYTPSSGLFSCPIAMTDGAAKTLEPMKEDTLHEAYRRLTSREPSQFWTSGQWMTEKAGGSDVAGGTQTFAIPDDNGLYRLYGYKWFSSATDSDMTLTLARIVDANGNFVQGTRGLTMFFLNTKDGVKRNEIQIAKLKNKLGTRQLPTAELLLDGPLAYKLSEEGRGVASISRMLQITRIHNSVAAASAMKRLQQLASDYAHKRKVFGKVLKDHPLHVQTLARMELEARASLCLIFEVGKLLGKEECNVASEEDLTLLRILNPVVKLYTAKQAMSVVSEGLEAFGGQGYIEDTGIPKALRDAQVLPIWEGTTNVLSMDVLRVLAKTQLEALKVFNKTVEKKLSAAMTSEKLAPRGRQIVRSLKEVEETIVGNPMMLEVGARDFAFTLARTYIASTLIEIATKANASRIDEVVALRWCDGYDLFPFLTNNRLDLYSKESVSDDRDLAFET